MATNPFPQAPVKAVKAGRVRFGGGAPLALIAGPCVIESRAMAFDLAAQLRVFAFEFVHPAAQRLGIGRVFIMGGLRAVGPLRPRALARVAGAFRRLPELGFAGLRGAALLVLGQAGHRGGGADRDRTGLQGLDHFGRGLGVGLQGREQQGQAERDPGQRRKMPRASFVRGCEADSRSKDRL